MIVDFLNWSGNGLAEVVLSTLRFIITKVNFFPSGRNLSVF